MTRFRDWWLDHAPGPWWLLSACRPIAPWCLIDELAHQWFPMTFGFYSSTVSHDPPCWICRRHNASAEKWARKHYPEGFDD